MNLPGPSLLCWLLVPSYTGQLSLMANASPQPSLLLLQAVGCTLQEDPAEER